MSEQHAPQRGDRGVERPLWDRATNLRRDAFEGGPDVSLIPAELRYVDQLHRYEYQTQQSGLSKMHGLRHAYAQDRYLELTGWECPVRGGPAHRELDPDALKTDFEARMAISAELGHGREEITTVYLGR